MEMKNVPAATYEYRAVEVSERLEPLARDVYATFGWLVDPVSKPSGRSARSARRVMSMKRPRRLAANHELRSLQSECEQAMAEVERLEATKTFPASAAACAVGLIGCAFMALATFSYLAGAMAWMVAFAIPGFACWAAPYFLYRAVCARTAVKRASILAQAYDRIYAASESAAAMAVQA